MKSWFNRLITFGAVVLSAFVNSGYAKADAMGDAIVAKIDKEQSRFKTLWLEYTVTTKEPKRKARVMKARARLKGKKQLTELLAPADVKGTKALHLSPTQIYVYLPAYRKVRRIASHVVDQGFMGSTFSQFDMNLTRYGRLYTGQLTSADERNYQLTLRLRRGKKAPYAKIKLTVEKARSLPLRIRYFDGKGRLVKTETRSKYVCEKRVCIPRKQKMIDHTKGNKYSKLKLTKRKVNPPLANSLFSKRNLRP